MHLYYKILGLEPGASQTEIKRSYFKLIRKYSPESDPERFQQIREAYEQLKNAENAPDSPSFPAPAEPWAQKMLEQIEKYNRQKNNEKYRDACEEAWNRFPEEIQFLYMLNIAQRRCRNTGKAIKTAELLVKKEPDNKWFHRELALSYLDRGFTKKAFAAFEHACELGCNDLHFLLEYGTLCLDNHQYDKGLAVLINEIRQHKKYSRQQMQELVNTHLCLLNMHYFAHSAYLAEILDSLSSIMNQYSMYMKPYLADISEVLSQMCVTAPYGSAEYEKVNQLFDQLYSLCNTDEVRESIDEALDDYYLYRLEEDVRIGETIHRYIEVIISFSDYEPQIQKFALLDTQLCMLKERDSILKQAKFMQQEHPQVYEKMADFIPKLENEKNLPILKSNLLKTYQRLEPMFPFGYYYKLYPEERTKAKGTFINDSEDEPYIRPAKKIGRNDPCPCGSGKKYKHCCMNK